MLAGASTYTDQGEFCRGRLTGGGYSLMINLVKVGEAAGTEAPKINKSSAVAETGDRLATDQ